jgi:S1-C subfamily serine protease
VLFVALIGGSFAVGHAMVGSPSSNNPSSNTSATVVVPPSATDLQQTLIDVAKTVQPSVVEVTSLGGNSEAIGSGVILTRDGYIVTNDHVVSGYTSFTVTLSDKTSYQAQVVGQDAQDDLAVLKISASNLTPIIFANSDQLQVGEFAVAIGSPLGLEESTTFGIVSALNRAASEAPSGPASELAGLIQTSAAINPGNSGGALVNLQGQLIGMPTLGATNPETSTAANDIGFAIPSNRIKYVADQLIQNGHLTSTNQGFLGIQGQDVTPNGTSTQQGVRVMGFANDTSGKSPAQQSGIQQGDIITAVNGQAITGNDDLAGTLLTQKPGTQVKLTILRGSAQQTITVTLGERPVGN